MTDWRALNRARWDEMVPLHVASDFYDVAAFRAGASTLRPFEIDELGDVTGRRLVHLQCHFGLDTLSWARRGAQVAGLDFSGPAVEAARALAQEEGIDAEFVRADVYDAPAVFSRRFDIVYTGLGSLAWLQDIQRWADVVAALLDRDGVLYLAEFHPITDVFGDTTLDVVRPYFHDPAGEIWDEPGSYADASARCSQTRTIEWRHPLSDVVTAILQAGLRLELLSEHDYTLFPRWPFLVRHGDGTYHLPDDMPRLPLMYSLRARRP